MSTSSAAPATAPPRSTAARPGMRRWVKVVLAIVIVNAVAFVAYMATMVFGNVLGTEFCPYTFERRGFAFREIPFIGIQISSIDRRTDTGVVELHLIKQGYIVPDATKCNKDTWHLLSLIRLRGTWATGDAELLMKYLDAQNDKEEFAWLTWSENHPPLAKVLWPAVAQAAQDGNYFIIPDLFSHARSTKDPVELQKKIDGTLAKVAKPAVVKKPAETSVPPEKTVKESPAKKS